MALDVAQIEGLISPTGGQGMSRVVKMQEPHPGESMENARGVECFPRCACRGLIKPCRHLYAPFSFGCDGIQWRSRLYSLAEASKFNTNTVIIASLQVNCLNFDSSSTAALGCTLSFIGC